MAEIVWASIGGAINIKYIYVERFPKRVNNRRD